MIRAIEGVEAGDRAGSARPIEPSPRLAIRKSPDGGLGGGRRVDARSPGGDNGPMRIRRSLTILLFASALLAQGCGEPERPRFTPASATDAAPPSKSSGTGGGGGAGTAAPRNIPTH